MQDRPLITRVLSGDTAAEKELYEAHVDRVYRLTYRMTGDTFMAEDCTQETFIRAFTKLAHFQGRATLSTWIHSIAVSVVLNSLRKVRKLRNRETELNEVIANREGPRTDVELKIRLQQAIDALPNELRLVFLMHDDGYKHREIADILDVPAGTAKSRLSRARHILRRVLAGGGREKTGEDSQ